MREYRTTVVCSPTMYVRVVCDVSMIDVEYHPVISSVQIIMRTDWGIPPHSPHAMPMILDITIIIIVMLALPII